jgi:hypothetical protein
MRPELEARFRAELRRFEERGRDRVESIYEHRRIARRETMLDVADEDLFAERTWLAFGLSRRDLVATGAWVGRRPGRSWMRIWVGRRCLRGRRSGLGSGHRWPGGPPGGWSRSG